MPDIPKEDTTHTSEAFVDFAYDLLEYTMTKYGMPVGKPEDRKRRSPKLFRDGFGEVVILFRSRNSENFPKLFSIANMADTEDIMMFVARYSNGIFKGIVPLMELISYCAFLVDMAYICFALEDPDMLYTIVEDTADVFNRHIKPYFTIVGGWFALYRVAKQYKMYVDFEPESNPAVSVEKDFLIKESSDVIKF